MVGRMAWFDEAPWNSRDISVLSQLVRTCPGPLQTVLLSDKALPMQLQQLCPQLCAEGGIQAVSNDGLEDSGWHSLADEELDGTCDWIPVADDCHGRAAASEEDGPESAAAAIARDIEQELAWYSGERVGLSLFLANVDSPTSKPSVHSFLARALKRFVASPQFTSRDGAVLGAWCELLDFLVEERIFTQTKWLGRSSKFERCLTACLALLKRFRDEHAGAEAAPPGPSQCALRRTDVSTAMERFGASPSSSCVVTSMLLTGSPALGCMKSWQSYLLGHLDSRTVTEDVLVQVVGWTVFSLGSVSLGSPFAGRVASAGAAEAARLILQASTNWLGQSRQARTLGCAYAILGLSPAGAHVYTPGRIEAQLDFALQAGGDELVTWAAYEYIRRHQHPDLRDPFQVRSAALSVLKLDPAEDYTPERIRKRRWTLCRLFDDFDEEGPERVHKAYEELSAGWIEEHYCVQHVVLGAGAFGTVRRGVRKKDQHVVAIKEIRKSPVTSRLVQQERALMMACGAHDNILCLLDHFESADRFHLVFEYCDGGDLADKLRQQGASMQADEVAAWLRDICAAVARLHAARICHRDVKPGNFLISGRTLKLADFGLAVFVAAGRLRTEKCGTFFFMAPEQHALPGHSPGYSFPVDIWAAGVTLYIMMHVGWHPFPDGSRGQINMKALARGSPALRFPTFDPEFGPLPEFPEEARELVRRMLCSNPEARISADEVLDSPWLRPQQETTSAGQDARH